MFPDAPRRLPVLGQDGDEAPLSAPDGEGAPAIRQRDAPAVVDEMLGAAAADLPEQVGVFAAVHWTAEDGVEAAMEVPGLLPEFPTYGEVLSLDSRWFWLRRWWRYR